MLASKGSMRKFLLFLAIVFAFVAVPPARGEAKYIFQRSQSALSPRLALLANAALTHISATEIAREIGLPENGAGSLARLSTGEVLVYIRVRDITATTRAALQRSGAQIRHTAAEYGTVTAFVAPQNLSAVAKVPDVLSVQEVLQPSVRGPVVYSARQHTPAQAQCPTGIVSEGDTQLKAAEARATFDVSGAGTSVGVLSNSFGLGSGATTPEDDVASGDLPGEANPCGHSMPVQVLEDGAVGGTDEGRAMLQIVHDLAPEAKLLFATADNGVFAFADNIRALRQAGADILVDDILYPGEPFFQDGPINVAIQEVVAQGAQYFTAAGNANVVDRAGHNVSSYEASAFRPTECPALPNLPASSRPRDCHNFAPATAADPASGFTLDRGASLRIELQWAEPWFGVVTDLDFYLIDSTTGEVLAGSANINVSRTQQPVEEFSYTAPTPTTVALVIGRFSGAATPRIKYVIQGSNSSLPGNGIASTEYHSENNQVDVFGPTLGDHAATIGAMSIAATRYSDGTLVEPFSSIGPATHYFSPIFSAGGSDEPLPKQPAPSLAQPQVIDKPDLAASDGVQTTFFNQFDGASQSYRFFGTSAAAPHAAGVAALLSERARGLGLTPSAGLTECVLESTATPMVDSTAAHGAGLVNALEALRTPTCTQLRLFAPIITQARTMP